MGIGVGNRRTTVGDWNVEDAAEVNGVGRPEMICATKCGRGDVIF